jgi:hypothetical protein
MEGPLSKPYCLTAARTAAALVAGVVLLVGMSACGSDSDSEASKAKPSTTVAKKEALGKLGVFLRVVNKGPEQMYVVMCHPDGCAPGKSLRTGENADMSAGSVYGRFFYERPGQPAKSVSFRAVNPAIGKPYITASPEGSGGGIEWNFSEGQYTSQCYALGGVGEVSGKRDTDLAGYKRLWLEPTSKGACENFPGGPAGPLR